MTCESDRLIPLSPRSGETGKDPSVCRLLGDMDVGVIDGRVVDIRLEGGENEETLAGNSNGGIVLSSLAEESAETQTDFSASHDAARSKLCSRSDNLIE